MAGPNDNKVFGFNRLDTDQILDRIDSSETEYEEAGNLNVIGTQLFKIPAGGMSARSGDTPGSADCYVVTHATTLSAGTTTKTVYNLMTKIFPEDMYIFAILFSGKWYMCPAGIIDIDFSSPDIRSSVDTSDTNNWVDEITTTSC